MNLGKILSSIVDRKSSAYDLSYSNQFDSFFTKLNNIPDISSLKISKILLITDQTPFSLISIAYMVRFAEALGKETEIYAITEKKHSEALKKICDDHSIQLKEVQETTSPTVDTIRDYIISNDIGLVLISYSHRLKKLILDEVSVSVLITSLKNI